MTKGPATEAVLGDLHSKVAKVMTRALDQIETRQNAWEDHKPTEDEIMNDPPELNPALLSVMVRFLDANKITCAPEAGNGVSDLEQRLAAKRTRRQVGNVVHMHEDE